MAGVEPLDPRRRLGRRTSIARPGGAPDLEFADWQVIDLAGAVEHPDLCDAALSYLLERMRLEVEDPSEAARLKLMVVDEAWRYLQDPAVLNYLAEAAKTWRKKNAALILATQSAVDVTSTPGAAALLESIPTKLFLANPELPDEVGALFRLNDSELAQVRGLIPKRELYLRRPDGAAVLRLEVDPESYWLYTSSALDAEERARAVERHGLSPGPRGSREPRRSHPHPQRKDLIRHATTNDTHRSNRASPGCPPCRGYRPAGGRPSVPPGAGPGGGGGPDPSAPHPGPSHDGDRAPRR